MRRIRCCRNNYLQYVDGSQGYNQCAAMSSVKATQKSHHSHRLNDHSAKNQLCLYADWGPIISSIKLERLIWVFSPSHAGVQGNERADSPAGTTAIDNNFTIDPPTVIKCVTEQLAASRPESSSYTLSLLKDKGVQPGEAANCKNRGITRRRQNQLLMETVSLQTIKYTLMLRDEQAWDCPTYRDSDGDDRYYQVLL